MSSNTNEITKRYPFTVTTSNNTALVNVKAGKSYVPIIFKGLSNVINPILWKANGTCWEQVDQSVHGKDFWQVDCQATSNTFDLIYNVQQDNVEDMDSDILYYLGPTPPSSSILLQSCLLYTSPSPRDKRQSRMPSSA